VRARIHPCLSEPRPAPGRARAIRRLAQMARPFGARRPHARRRGDDRSLHPRGAEIRREDRRQSALQARRRPARARAERSDVAQRRQSRFRCGVRCRRSVRFRPHGPLSFEPSASGHRQHRSRAGGVALDLGTARRAAGQFTLREEIRWPAHGRARLGSLDGGQDDRAIVAADGIRRFRQAARVHPGRRQFRWRQRFGGQRAPLGPSGATSGAAGSALRGRCRCPGRGLFASHQHARHTRRRRARVAVPLYK
jgi:hypothetical protein